MKTIDKAVNETVATKSDLALQGAKIDALIETVEGLQENIDKNMATKADLAKFEARIMRMMWFQLVVLAALLILLNILVAKLP